MRWSSAQKRSRTRFASASTCLKRGENSLVTAIVLYGRGCGILLKSTSFFTTFRQTECDVGRFSAGHGQPAATRLALYARLRTRDARRRRFVFVHSAFQAA